jgi:hypothetical protein
MKWIAVASRGSTNPPESPIATQLPTQERRQRPTRIFRVLGVISFS